MSPTSSPSTTAESRTHLADALAERRKPVPVRIAALGVVGCRILRDREIDDARLAAVRYLKRVGADVDVDPDFLDREQWRQIAARAFVRLDEGEVGGDLPPVFEGAEDVRELDAVLVEELTAAYLDVQQGKAAVEPLSDATLESLVDAFAADDGSDPLAFYRGDLASMRGLVRLLAQRLRGFVRG